MDFKWMLEIFSPSQCKRDKSYVLLEQQSKVVKRSIILEEKSRTCWMSSITLWAKRLFFVQNSFQAALNIPIVFKFGKQNSSSKIFLVKRWHFWTCFYITKGDESKIPWWKGWTWRKDALFQMFSFRKWCFKFSIFHHKAEFKYPSIYDCHLNTWKSPKMQRSNFGNLGLREKIFDFCLCWQKTEMIFRLKWVYQYIGI